MGVVQEPCHAVRDHSILLKATTSKMHIPSKPAPGHVPGAGQCKSPDRGLVSGGSDAGRVLILCTGLSLFCWLLTMQMMTMHKG